jgi:hypothetical protein
MIVITSTSVERIFLALLILSPAVACAKPIDQAASGQRGIGTSAKGVTLQDFVKRRASRQLAADTDGDGKVSKAEFLAAAKAGKADPTRRFARLDRNGDGLLDKSEIETMLSRRFKRLDADGDGVASSAERGAARKKSPDVPGNETES